MKQLAFCFCLTLAFASCSETPPPLPQGFSERSLCLKDSSSGKNLGLVRLAIPPEFDTLLTWIDWSDAGGEQKYRFVNSRGCLIKESGFFKTKYCHDSIRRFTIEHQFHSSPIGISLDTTLVSRIVRKVESVSDLFGNPVRWKTKGIQKINGNDFGVFHYIGADYFTDEMEAIFAITLVGNDYIEFRWECASNRNSITFIREAQQTLASIQIDTTCRQ